MLINNIVCDNFVFIVITTFENIDFVLTWQHLIICVDAKTFSD